jgi:lipoprotein NlpI
MTVQHMILAAMVLLLGMTARADDSVDDYLKQAAAAFERKDPKAALELAGKAIAADPKDARGCFLRGEIYEKLRKHDDALTDFNECLKRDPRHTDAYQHRGCVQFCRGKVAEALADFDIYLKLKPAAYPDHWQRGICLYYLRKFDEGAKQFHAYEKISTDDVENAVWHFLCLARKEGVAKAREKMLKIGKDARIPMMEVYDLFRGKIKPADVLAAVEASKATGLARQEEYFYAHLYLGLYYDVLGERDKALEHLELATGKYGRPHYMGDVARVHLDYLKKTGSEPR